MKLSSTIAFALGLAGTVYAAPESGTATLAAYNKAANAPAGTVEVTQGEGGKIKLVGKLTGADKKCTKDSPCGAHIHAGYGCDVDEPAGHYWYGTVEDTWLPSEQYNVDAESGEATFTHEVADIALEKVLGRTVVIHDSAGDKVACGVIVPEGLGETVLGAKITPYPDAEAGTALANFYKDADVVASLKVKEGSTAEKSELVVTTDATEKLFVAVSDACPDTLVAATNELTDKKVELDLKYADVVNKAVTLTVGEGDEAAHYCAQVTDKNTVAGYVMFYEKDDKLMYSGHANGLEVFSTPATAGWHVHEGLTCGEAGGHLMKGDSDPWKDLKYTVVESKVDNADKEAGRTYFTGAVEDVDLEFISNRTVVLHAQDGKIRQGCGVLNFVAEDDDTSGSSTAALSVSALLVAAVRYFF